MLGAPELDTALQVWSHQSRGEGQNHLPRPAGHASFDAAQDAVGFLEAKEKNPALSVSIQGLSVGSHRSYIAQAIRG